MPTGAGTTLANFNPATGFTDSDYVYMTQNGATVKGTVAQLKTAVAINATQETFVPGDGIVAGTFLPGGASITLAGTYGSINNLDVYTDGVPQLDCTLSGQTLGFSPAIPTGISKVIVRGKQARSIGTPSAATVTDSSIAPGSALYDRVFNVVSVEDAPFNASPTAADNWAAIQAAVTYALANGKALRIPRKYSLSKKVTGTGSLMIYGYGTDLSALIWPASATSVGMAVTLPFTGGLSGTAGLTDVSLITGGAAVGTAASFTGPAAMASDRITPRVVVDRVCVRGLTNPTVDGFGTGLLFDNCTGVVVDKYNFWGKINSAGEPVYDSLFAIRYDNLSGVTPHPTEFSFTNCRLYYAQTLIYANDFEGGYIHHNQLVGGNAGVRLLTPGPGYPHAVVNDNHINVSDFCIVVGGMYEVQIHDNLLYKQLGTGPGVGVNVSSGSQFCNVHHNTFENLHATATMNGIIFDTASNNMADGNIFRRMDSVNGTGHGIGVWMTANSSNNHIGQHQLYNACTAATVLDQGAGNVIET